MSADTLTLAQRLRAAELPVGHAEASAAAIGAAVLEGAATRENFADARLELKSDLAAARIELKSDIQLTGERLLARIESAKNQLLIWLIGAIFTAAGTVIAVARL